MAVTTVGVHRGDTIKASVRDFRDRLGSFCTLELEINGEDGNRVNVGIYMDGARIEDAERIASAINEATATANPIPVAA